MKIACIGNMNNMMFTLCRYLRDEGFDASLFVFKDEPGHFDPSADSYTDDYKKYTTYLPVNNESFYDEIDYKKIKSNLKTFEFFIGCDYAPAFLESLGLGLDVFIPHGSDIYDIPFSKDRDSEVNKIWWLKAIYYSGKLQLKAVRKTPHILFPSEYDQQFNYKVQLNTASKFYDTSGPMLYIPQYKKAFEDTALVNSLIFSNQFLKIRAQNDLVIFSHARHNGFNLPKELSLHSKGNEVLIIGVAQFIKQNKDVNVKLILFDYGINTTDSKRLVEELGLIQFVEWMPKMARKEILIGLSLSDISCGQFSNSWLTCGVVNETLALGKPLLHFRIDLMYKHLQGDLYYMLNAKTGNEIFNQLTYFISNKKKVIFKSEENINWIERYTVEKPINIIKKIILEGRKKRASSLVDKISSRCLRATVLLSLLIAKTGQKIRNK